MTDSIRNEILQGDVLEVSRGLPSQSVNMIVTSPPYFGLRDYGTAEWEGGDGECDHVERKTRGDNGRPEKDKGWSEPNTSTIQYHQTCAKCGATRIDQQMGLEETPEAYVANLVEVFRELWRVLRDDGTCWLNLGDSFLDKQLQGIPWRVALALQADGWYLRSDVIWHKCLSGGTVVYAQTQKGEMPTTIKDLVRLDPSTVKLWTGKKWSQVISWEEVKPDPNRKSESQNRRSHKYRTNEMLPHTGELEIHLRSGEKIGCTQDHRFPTQRGLLEASELKPGDILQSCLLPEPKFPKSPKHLPDRIGWLVGLYLAEGSRSGETLQISGHTNEVERWARLEDLANDYGDHFRLYTSGNVANGHIDGKMLISIIDTYINGKLAKGKHLSPECWKRSNEFLSQVLQGYLDGDGHFDAPNNRWRLGFTKNDSLAQDLRTLSGRLGFSLRLKRAKHAMGDRKFAGWRGQIRFEQSDHFNSKSDTEIVKIEASRARKFWDIAIEDEPHLFALASGVLTHNSNPMPESVTDRPAKAHEYIFLLTKSARYWYDADAIREPHKDCTIVRWGAGGEDTTNTKFDKCNPQTGVGDLRNGSNPIHPQGRNRRTVWEVATVPLKAAHFAAFPPKLIEPCIRAGCPSRVCVECGEPWVRVVEKIGKSLPVEERTGRTGHNGQPPQISGNYWTGPTTQSSNTFAPTCQCCPLPANKSAHRPGIVLDPFFGSGTTAQVAIQNKRDWLGIELNPEYIKLAEQRIYKTQPGLFAI